MATVDRDTAPHDETRHRTLVELAPTIIYSIDANGRFTSLSPEFEAVTGWSPAAWIGRPFVELVHPDDLRTIQERFEGTLGGRLGRAYRVRVRRRAGDTAVIEIRGIPWTVGERIIGAIGVARDVTERAQEETELAVRLRQQEAVAHLGQHALVTRDLDDLFQRVTRQVSDVLRIEFCTLLELLADGETLVRRAWTGWESDDARHRVDGGVRSQAGYTLVRGDPVIVADMATETRFEVPDIMKSYGVTSGVSVPVLGQGGVYGVLGALTRRRRTFTHDDVHFMEAVAHVVASAIQRTQIEEALSASRHQFRVILEGVADGITVQDQAGGLVYANLAAARMIGFSSVEELRRTDWEAVAPRFEMYDEQGRRVSPADLPGRRVLRGEPPSEMRLRFRSRESRVEGWALVRSSPVLDERGRPHLAITVFHDVTARMQADATQAQLAALVQSSDDAIIGTDLDSTITNWNPGAERLYGYTAAEAIGTSTTLIVPPDCHAEVDGFMDRIRRGERIEHFETRRVRKDGSLVDVSVSISPVRNASGAITGAATIARDVTEHRRLDAERQRLLEREHAARSQVEASERRLRFLAEASEILSRSLEHETTLATVARLAVPALGDWCTIDVLEENGTLRRVALSHPDPDKERYARELERRYPADPSSPTSPLRTGESVLMSEIPDELLVTVASDEEHLALLRGLGLRSAIAVPLQARGRVLGVLTLISAESAQRYDRDDLSLLEDLARRAALAVDNARLFRQAQAMLALREEFLSIASHELKTPLTALHLQIQVLTRWLTGDDSGMPARDRTRQILEGVDRQMKRLSRLVNDLLDVARIGAGRLDVERREIDLTALVAEVVDRFHVEVAASGSAITVRGEPVTVWADPFRVDQVVTNLLSNAIRYGEGRPIEITVDRQPGAGRVQVRDHGIGIAAHQIQLVFDRFERVAVSHNYGGLGLGLYIARQIVEAHGGRVLVESAEGKGSVFTVELPLRPPD